MTEAKQGAKPIKVMKESRELDSKIMFTIAFNSK